MRRLFLSTVALMALNGTTFAADLPSAKVPPAYAPPPPVFTWTGFYVGANVGLGAGSEKASRVPNQGNQGYDRYDSGGVLGGFQIGGNYQIDHFVLGVEADYDFTGVEGASSFNLNLSNFIGQGVSGGGEIDSLRTVRGRLGYAFLDNRALIYATGGFAYGQVKGFDHGSPPVYNFDQSFSATGWAAGAGLEYALTGNWTIRAEFLYADLGSSNWTHELADFRSANKVTLDSSVSLIRVGLNYKFGAPVPISTAGFVASATDLPSTKGGPLSAPPPPVFTWTGFYVGANVGLGTGSEKISYLPNSGYDRYNSGGVLGGLQIGGNYQIDHFVLGAEADYDFAGIEGADHHPPDDVYGGEIDSLGTVRGRLGYAFLDNRALIYATGGFAYGQVQGLDHGLGPAYNHDQSFSATGWAAGAGFEYALTNRWTVRAEYLYADLGPSNWTNEYYSNVNKVTLDSSVSLLRLGLNYKFGGAAPAPVVAKY